MAPSGCANGRSEAELTIQRSTRSSHQSVLCTTVRDLPWLKPELHLVSVTKGPACICFISNMKHWSHGLAQGLRLLTIFSDFTQTDILEDFYNSLELSLEGKADESAIYMGELSSASRGSGLGLGMLVILSHLSLVRVRMSVGQADKQERACASWSISFATRRLFFSKC